MRTPLFPLLIVPLGFASAAHAEISGLRDLQIVQSGQSVTMRIDFEQQPRSADISLHGDDTIIAIDGVSLQPLSFATRKGLPFARVSAAPSGESASALTLSGANLSNASVTIYRNSVVVSATLETAAPQPAAQLAAVSAPAPSRSPAPAPKPAVFSEAGAISLTPKSGAEKPAAPKVPSLSAAPIFDPAHPSARLLAGVTAPACASAAEAIRIDEWNLAALGPHALCLIDAGDASAGAAALERLAMMDPTDWHAPLGRGVIELLRGHGDAARKAFATAAHLTKDPALMSRLNSLAKAAAASASEAADHGLTKTVSLTAESVTH